VRHYGRVVTVRYFAAARAAAGVAEEATDAATLGALVERLGQARGERLARVLGVASFLVDGLVWRDREQPLPAAATIDVLPPFAGG
jgi:molybdopterin synthase sulfur carrier subunit